MGSNSKDIRFVSRRMTVEVHLPDGRVLEGRRGTPVGDFLRALEGDPDYVPVAGALVNSELRELTYPIEMDSRVKPVTMADEDGMRIYRRTLTFLLEAVFNDLFPEIKLTIDHSVAAGGYFCQVAGRPVLKLEELQEVKKHMDSYVERDLPFVRTKTPLEQAVSYFKEKGFEDKVRLLAHRKKDFLVLYKMGNHCDYHHGYMLPSTGYIKWFDLEPVNGGFTLRFPQRKNPTHLTPPIQYPKMLATFRRYGDLLEKLGIVSVGALNDAILSNRIKEIILVSEARHERRIAEIAVQIASQRDQARVVLISGPSSSGKTTTSKRLTVQLLASGISPFPLEMDNYFLDRSRTPRDKKGDYDFESLYALDLKRLSSDLNHLIAGKPVQLPHFNFLTGLQEPGDTVQLNDDQIIIMEGIHGMNPGLLPDLAPEKAFRMYVSALTQLNLDRHNRVSTTDTRLLRRIVRDARERGYSAQETIRRWESVTRGEKRNIFPYQENADVMFNSALVYEMAALKQYAEPLLRQVPFGTQEYVEAKRLLALLEWFLPVDRELVPDNSILNEFLGGSILKGFSVWQHV